MTNSANNNQTTATCDICIITDTFTQATHECETCDLNCCDDCAGDNYNLDHSRIDGKDSPEHNCKHGVDVYNCYDGCYDEMKNGTVN